MNNPSPLLPQGSMLEQNTKNKGRARVKIAVFFVLAIHGVGLLALLMQGCKGEKDSASNQTADTNTTTYAAAPVETFTPTNPAVVLTTNTDPVNPGLTTSAPVPPIDNPGVATDYVVKSGDTYATIARSKKVSVNSLKEANPGVEPTKLQIGQKLHVPPPTAPTSQTANNGAPAVDAHTGDPVYTVKSGDTLIKIASEHKTTVRALRTANSLRTDSIKVGQKLKIPVKMADAGTGPMASNNVLPH
jgi:LysM repeat protein